MSDLYLCRLRGWILSSPPAEFILSYLRELLIGALQKGPIPQHVAFIMDGNRRFARSHKIETLEGHNRGFETLARILDVCYMCGVRAVTVYAFSTENFHRPKYEVDGIMQLAKVKLAQLSEHGELLERYGASVRILGERDRIPPDVLEVCDRAVEMTRHNTAAILNICFPYTSREEITSAIRETVTEFTNPPAPQSSVFSPARISQTIKARNLDDPGWPRATRHASPAAKSDGSDPEDSISSSSTLNHDSPPPQKSKEPDIAVVRSPEAISARTIEDHLYTAGCPALDIIIRTSGVTRLSDFMLWQCHQNTHIAFLECLWPEFDLWQFVPVILEWQWRQKKKAREEWPSRRPAAAAAAAAAAPESTTKAHVE